MPGARERFLAHPRHGPLPALLLLLTVVSGVVDAVSILRLGHVFVANMTGNIAFLGFGVAGASGFSLRASLSALGGFALGATATGWLPGKWSSDRPRLLRTAALAKLSFAVPVVTIAAFSSVSPGHPTAIVLIVLLSASMGVQNSTARRMAVPDMTTTIVTLAVTGLFSELRRRGWRDPAIGYRFMSVLCLFAGAVVGATLVVEVSIASALGLAAVLIGLVGAVAHRATSQDASWAPFPAP